MITLKQKSDCCGCGACQSICTHKCIQLKQDNEGFLYPDTNLPTCTNCNQCNNVCPIINITSPNTPQKSYVAINNNAIIRDHSSSGGIFYTLASYIISQNGVVFGAKFTKDFTLIHDECTTIESLVCLVGAKYVQSYLGESFIKVEQYLKVGKLVLFSGVGCQIAALKNFLKKEYSNLLTIDVLCHGVGSPSVWKTFINNWLYYEKDSLKSINFRDKSIGWEEYRLRLEYLHQNVYLNSYDNTYITGYFANLFLRPSCYHCVFKPYKSNSDITLADAWGINKLLDRKFCIDNKGTSLIIVNTKKGDQAIQSISANISYEKINLSAMIHYNPSLKYPSKENKRRNEFFYRFNNGEDFEFIIRDMTKLSILQRLEQRMTPFLKRMGIKGFTKKIMEFIKP